MDNENNAVNGDGMIDVESEIKINYSYNKHPRRGYHCAYTEGMDKYGSPELCLMDYYSPEEAEYILLNMADCILNGDIYNPELDEYDFTGIVELEADGRIEYRFGFISGFLYDTEVMCLQQVDEHDFPVHPGGDLLTSYYKRGFEVCPLFMFAVDEEEDEDESDEEDR